MMKIMRVEDPTRPVTTANNNPNVEFMISDAPDFVDVYGFNYRYKGFAPYRKARPEKPTISTETGCYIATRGEYFFPLENGRYYWDLHSTGYMLKNICSMEDEWAAHDAEPSHTGGFYWTGFDYLGGPDGTRAARQKPNSVNSAVADRMKEEIAQYGMVKGSMRACATGMFDLAGFPRDTCAQFRARWRPDEPMTHLLPHWNWPERVGQKTPVMAFTSGDEVELFLNGKSQGRQKVAFPGARCRWDDVVYTPGVLKAVAYKNGKMWCEKIVETTGTPAKLVLEAESATPLVADGESVTYVNLSVLDAQGRVVPRTRLPVRIAVSDALELVGVENGDDADLTPFRGADHIAFNGHLSIVVRPKLGVTGPYVITATAAKLPTCMWLR